MVQGEAEFVANGAVGDDALAAGVGGEFGDEGPAALLGGFVEEILEGSFEAEFVGDLLGFKVLEVLEIGLDDRVAGGQFEHRVYYMVSGGRIGPKSVDRCSTVSREKKFAHR